MRQTLEEGKERYPKIFINLIDLDSM